MGDYGGVSIATPESTPTEEASPDVPEPVASEPDSPAAPPKSRYSMGSSANMVRSLIVILGLVAVLIAIVPRISSVDQPAVDAASVVGYAVTSSKGVAFEAPVGLPTGWKATSARYEPSTDGIVTWQGGWTTPSTDGYVSIRQAVKVSGKWITAATDDGVVQGAVQAGGRTWEKRYSAQHNQTSLVDEHPDGLTTVITATAPMGDILTFTNDLKPAAAR